MAGNISELRCMIVDDHALIRKMTKDVLLSMGIENIEFAENGKIAHDKLQAKINDQQPQYDIVFLDWAMPELDGYSVLKACREDKNYDNVAFVMVTAESEKAEVIKALKSGATSYIQKPYTDEEFKEKLRTVLEWVKERKKHD